MKLFISTPCSGGMLYDGYVNSLIQSTHMAKNEGIVDDIHIHFQGKESLIHRARDRAAMAFLESKFDKLLTIDADIVWTYQDFKRIILSDKDVVGGIYPIKTFPIVANFNPLKGKGDELFKSERGIDLIALDEFQSKYADDRGEAEVRHVPTGFMCVTRRVFETLSRKVDPYATFDSASGQKKGFFHFYPSGVHEWQLESEDWGFSRIAREAGFPAYINTKVLLGHIGNHQYRMGQVFGEVSD